MAEQAPVEQAAAPSPPPPPVETKWSWGQYPTNRIDSSRMVVPLGCLHTPIAGPAQELPYAPLRCPSCTGVLNPYCHVDHRSSMWHCPFCNTRTAFPQSYASMTEHQLPAELMKQFPTVEYVQPQSAQHQPPTFVLVVDTCVDTADEAAHLRNTLALVLAKLPENCRVGLVTFGATVQLHDLCGRTEFPRSLVLRGSTEVTVAALRGFLKNHSDRYVQPFADAEFTLTSIIEDLTVDLWPVQKDHRPLRCTGAAISAAASLLEIVSPKQGSAVMAFLSGICTEGPGKSVELGREHLIRGHADLKDDLPAAKFHAAAVGFYDTIMRRMVGQGHALHVIQAALDQCGVAEMKLPIQATGGICLTNDSWRKPNLRESICRYLSRRSDGLLNLGMNATIDCVTSPTWKVMGCIGQCIGTGRKSSCIADTEIGYGGTCQWTTCSLDCRSTFAFYFESSSGSNQPSSPNTNKPPVTSTRYVQFIVKYQLGGKERIRVTTLPHTAVEPANFVELGKTFDQEAAAVLMGRIAVHKADTTPIIDVLRWVDRHTIRIVSRFGDYVKDQPQSVKLAPELSAFPLFMFHLRRSAYLEVFNNSPDETAVLRILLLKSPSSDSILMIHPTLHSYVLGAQPVPVPLDISSSKHDNLLLLDTFFEVLIHHGETIKAWRAAGYEDNEDFAHFKKFLCDAREKAEELAATRVPCPLVIECGQGDPQARILYNRLNPSKTHMTAGSNYGANPGELVYTDDASLQTFMDHLKKLAVQPM